MGDSDLVTLGLEVLALLNARHHSAEHITSLFFEVCLRYVASHAVDPFSGRLFVFRGRRGDRVKMLWWDGDGLCLFAKCLEGGRFVWPQAASGTVHLTAAQLSMLLEGIDWRGPRRTHTPELAV